MAFGMNIEGIGTQIGNLSKEGLEKLNTNLEEFTSEVRRSNDITVMATGLSMFADSETQERAQAILKAMVDDLAYKYL